MFLIIVIVCLCIGFAAVQPSCAASNPKMLHFTVDEGLINGNIHQISQDEQGFVWLATENGLVRCDGFDYRVFQTSASEENSISHNFVNAVSPEINQSIWIGTMAGLDRFNPVKGSFEHFHFYNASGSINMKPALKVFPNDDDCFVLTDDKYLYYCATGDDTLRPIIPLNDNPKSFVMAAVRNSADYVVIGDKQGRVASISKNAEFRLMYDGKSSVSAMCSLRDSSVCVCFIDGSVVVLKKGEMRMYTLKNLQDPCVNDVMQLTDSTLLLATRSDGVFELSLTDGALSRYMTNLVNNNCTSLLADSFGNIWVGHAFGGVSLKVGNSVDFNSKDFIENVPSCKVLAVAECGGKNFQGTDGAGLYMYDRVTRSRKVFNFNTGLEGKTFDNVITSLFADGDCLWIGTYNHGVYAYSVKSGTLQYAEQLAQCPEKGIATIYVDSRQDVWIGTYESGVYVFNKEQKKFIRHYTGYEDDGNLNISCNGSTCFFEDAYHNIWIGSYYGITKISESGTTKIYRYDAYPGMRSSVVTTITQNVDGRVWFGSLQGLSYYDADRDTICALSNGQISNGLAICSIVPQVDSSMLVVTPKTVYVYLPTNNFVFVSALSKGEFQRNALCLDENKLYVGTDRDVKSLFVPVLVSDNRLQELRLTDVLLHGRSIFACGKKKYTFKYEDGIYYLDLPYDEGDVTIKFSDFYFDETRPKDYLYKLEGFQNDWRLLQDENTVSYANLPGGDYVFWVKHLMDSSDSKIELRIHKAKALWEMKSFYIAIFLLVLVLVVVFFMRRMQRVIRMRNRLQRQVELRIKDIQQKNQQIELQNMQIKLQRDAATRQRSEAEHQREGAEKKLSVLLGKLQKSEDLIQDLKQRTVNLSHDRIVLKRKVDLYENNVDDVVFKMMLPSEKIEYVSPSVQDLTGYSDKDFLENQVSFRSLLLDEEKKNVKQYRTLVMEGKIPEIVQFTILDKDGNKKNVRQYSRYETDLKGAIIALEFRLELVESVEVPTSENEIRVAEKEIVNEPSVERYDWSSKTVLVADSDDESFSLITEALAPTHISILRVTDGLTLVEDLKQKKYVPDVILLDVQLSRMNGFEAVVEIRKFDKQIPIVAQTLYSNYESKLKCFDAGFDTYVSKPYKSADLQDVLAKILNV